MTTVFLYSPQGTDHVAVVSTQPSWTHPGRKMISVARGPSRRKLGQAVLYGPLSEAEVEPYVNELVSALRAEGFVRGGLAAQLAALDNPSPRRRALAALRLGWLREEAAVEPLIAAAARAGEDRCTIIDALGAVGDPRAIPACRQDAERKLLSRRRSGAEALRRLGDDEGLAGVRERALQRLPEPLRAVVGELEEHQVQDEAVARVVETLAALPPKSRGLALDSLYEMATPLAVASVRQLLPRIELGRPYVWRYAKSVLKRSMLRHDGATFGRLVHLIEREGRATGADTQAAVKSGYDGKVRETTVFSRRTRNYVRRRAWRYLRRLAAYRPELYAPTAAEAVVHYDPKDETQPKGEYGAYASCYLLHRVIWGGGSRFELKQRSMRFRLRSGAPVHAAPGEREEAYPQLWDRQPRAYLRLLVDSRLIAVHEIALRAVEERHRSVLEAAPDGDVVALLGAPHAPTVDLGVAELRRRFDPSDPSWPLLQSLLDDGRETVRELGLEWLAATVGLWSRQPDRCVRVLAAKDPVVRAEAARLCINALEGATPDQRRGLAAEVLATLRAGEAVADTHQGLASVASQVLLGELQDLLSPAELLALLQEGSPAAGSVAAELLARCDDAIEALGLDRIGALARHQLLTIRRAALALLGRALPRFSEDPSLLLLLAECDWPDSRAAAVELLRKVDLSGLSLDALLELLDSNRVEVQALGRQLLLETRQQWDPIAVISRLLEHPHPQIRGFVVKLIEEQLSGDLTGLSVPESFYRKVLFDLWPSRSLKRRVIAVLTDNAERDEQQARRAISLLGDVLRTRTREDFEEALVGLSRIHLAFPELPLPPGVSTGERR